MGQLLTLEFKAGWLDNPSPRITLHRITLLAITKEYYQSGKCEKPGVSLRQQVNIPYHGLPCITGVCIDLDVHTTGGSTQ